MIIALANPAQGLLCLMLGKSPEITGYTDRIGTNKRTSTQANPVSKTLIKLTPQTLAKTSDVAEAVRNAG